MNAALQWCLDHPETVIACVVAILTMLKGKPWVDAQLANARTAQIQSFATVAFHAVEEAARLAPASAELKGAAKAALYLEKLNAALSASGVAPLKEAEKAVAADVASAINVAKKAAALPLV